MAGLPPNWGGLRTENREGGREREREGGREGGEGGREGGRIYHLHFMK